MNAERCSRIRFLTCNAPKCAAVEACSVVKILTKPNNPAYSKATAFRRRSDGGSTEQYPTEPKSTALVNSRRSDSVGNEPSPPSAEQNKSTSQNRQGASFSFLLLGNSTLFRVIGPDLKMRESDDIPKLPCTYLVDIWFSTPNSSFLPAAKPLVYN